MAGARVRVRLEGIEGAADVLRRFPHRFNVNLIRELERSSPAIEAELRRRTPALTGDLRASVVARRNGDVLEIGYTAKYAPFVYYRRNRFGARTVRQTLAKFRRSVHFRRLLRGAAERAVARTKRELEPT